MSVGKISEELFNETQKIAKIGCWEFEIESQQITWSEQMFLLFGEDPDAGEPSFEKHKSTVHPEDQGYWQGVVDLCIQNRAPYVMEFRVVHSNGDVVWIRAHGQALSGTDGRLIMLRGTCQDITEIKQRELVAKSISQIRKFQQGHPDSFEQIGHLILQNATYLTDSELGFLLIYSYDDQLCETVEVISFANFKEVVNKETNLLKQQECDFGAEAFKKQMHSIFKTRSIFIDNTYDDQAKNPVFSNVKQLLIDPLKDDDAGKVALVLANRKSGYNQQMLTVLNPFVEMIYDVLDHFDVQQKQKQAKEELSRQIQFLKATVDNLPGAFYTKDLQHRFTMVNEFFCKELGLVDSDVLGRKWTDLFDSGAASQFESSDQRAVEQKKSFAVEEVIIAEDGTKRYFDSFKFPYLDHDGEVYAVGGISIEITEKKDLERQAHHNSKLLAIGELAAGVGHEVNNPLAISDGNALKLKKILKKSNYENEEAVICLDKIRSANKRISAIVNGLRTFARVDEDANGVIDVVDSVKQVIGLIAEIYKRDGVKIDFKCEDESISIVGNNGRFQQAIMNLISNAKDAVSEQLNGHIHVSLKKATDCVKVEIEDNGHGIPEEIRARIFDSFYTTKPPGKGTGIGLSLTASIVKEHKGKIDLTSRVGRGTKFSIEFPAGGAGSLQVKEFDQESNVLDSEKPNNINVLVVDDEGDVLEVLVDIVESGGYRAFSARSAGEAIELIRKHRIDVVLTDIKMHEVDGVVLAKSIRLMCTPAPKIYAFSGGVNTNVDVINEFTDGYFRKPFDDQLIIRLLRDVKPIDQSSSSAKSA